jgi:hypothetical protein
MTRVGYKAKARRVVERLLNISPSLGFAVDHIDRNITNNDAKNLRVVTTSANNLNHGRRSISVDKKRGDFLAMFCGACLGRRKSYIEAVDLYDKAHIHRFIFELSKTRHFNQHLTDGEYYFYHG